MCNESIRQHEANLSKVDEMSRRLDNLEANIQATNIQTESDVEK
jgi:hypothetical protein